MTTTGVALTAAPEVHAEDLHVDERLVVAPVAGVFHPAVGDCSPDDPLKVDAGDEIGVVVASGRSTRCRAASPGSRRGCSCCPGSGCGPTSPLRGCG